VNAPDKGEKIRAFYLLERLMQKFRVHVACFARSRREFDELTFLRSRYSSLYVELLRPQFALAAAGMQFIAGRSLTLSFYRSHSLSAWVQRTARRCSCAVVYSSAMAQYVPAPLPLILDMVDVDSEKWRDYSQRRFPALPYRIECERLRRAEAAAARRAVSTFLTTSREGAVLASIASGCDIGVNENGVDFEFFDPAANHHCPELAGRRFVALIGAMDYYPNVEAARWFCAEVLPELRRRERTMEFIIVGRNPNWQIRRLAAQEGVAVTGAVADVRPYLQNAVAVVAPLPVARGIQNKVLEALAMGREVLASPAVCDTFGRVLPAGVVRCDGPVDFVRHILSSSPGVNAAIRRGARERFSWENNLTMVEEAVLKAAFAGRQARAAVS
jgi:sugar transferase (PEP-CTERM/EpsH1 system associated)